MTLSIRWHPDARAALRDLARRDFAQARRIQQRMTAYAETGQGDVRKLQGPGNRWRLRVGDWRVIFVFAPPGSITVLAVALRRDAYRD
jgi:mRNA-degrading endonuclease RelE of RelBE toxin-antitoxin system